MKKISITFYLDTFLFGGIEKTLLTYLSYFDRSKFDIKFVIGFNRGKAEKLRPYIPDDILVTYVVENSFLSYVKTKKIIEQKKTHLGFKLLDSIILTPITKLIFNFKINKILNDADIIIDYGSSDNLVKFNIATPIITFLHFSIKYIIGTSRNAGFNRNRLFRKLSNASHVITLNNDMYNECLQEFDFSKKKISVLYNPFDIQTIRELSEDDVGDFDCDNYIVTVCRLNEEQKDVNTLILAFDNLVRVYGYSGKLVIIGDGPDKVRLEQLSKDLNLEEQILFMGAQLNPFKFMKHSRLFVYSSKFDGLPSVLIEAKILKLPIVATDCPTGVSDILSDWKPSYLVNVGDVHGMSKSINDCLSQYNGSQEIIDYENIISKYSIKSILNKVMLIVNNAII